jgi:multidrug resistance efflux pump
MSNQKPLPDETKAQSMEDEQEMDKAATASVRNGALIIGLLIVFSLGWYLVADRFTPFTTQARVQGYVVGVAPKVAGVVTQVWVRNNQAVEAAQPLFEIDPSQYQIALKRAQSDLGNARSQVDAGTAAVESARANLRAALANELKAEKDYTRLARAKVSAAEAGIQQAIEQKGGDDDDSNAILKSAQSALEKAQLDLANTVVKASSRGVITDLRAEVGQYAGTGSPVMTLVAIDDVWINAEFTENNLGHMRPGTAVEILFDALPGQIFQGEVRSIGLGISAGQAQPPGNLPTVENNRDWLRQAQRFPVVIGFDITQQKSLRRQLRVGGQASVIVYSSEGGLLRMLGRAYIRLKSWLSYAY